MAFAKFAEKKKQNKKMKELKIIIKIYVHHLADGKRKQSETKTKCFGKNL